jgi:O-antigen biosynthesis protein
MKARFDLILQGQQYYKNRKLLILLTINERVGGGLLIISEAAAMQKMGVDVQFLNFYSQQADFERAYPDNPIPVIYVSQPSDIPDVCQKFDAVIATAYFTVEWLKPLENQKIKLAYYIQDFEPYFWLDKPTQYGLFWKSAWIRRRISGYFFRKNKDFREAWLSYFSKNLILFTKTTWNQREVFYQTGKLPHLVGISYDCDRFLKKEEKPQLNQINISAMIRPNTPRRNATFTMNILEKISQKYGEKVNLLLFGIEKEHPYWKQFDFPFQNLGALTADEVANLLNNSDIFVDFSRHQAMGLTALEAMACKNAVIIPKIGGADDFAIHLETAFMVDTSNQNVCLKNLQKLIENKTLRETFASNAQHHVSQFFPEKPALEILKLLLFD